MKVGDLVKRKVGEWTKHNIWLTFSDANEIGIVTKIENGDVVVLWPKIGLSWDDSDLLEIVNESR